MTLRGETEPLLRALFGLVLGFDESVTLKSLQRRVDLADVQGPDLAGSCLELLPQLEPVFGALTQKPQQSVTDTHENFGFVSIPSIVLYSYPSVQSSESQKLSPAGWKATTSASTPVSGVRSTYLS